MDGFSTKYKSLSGLKIFSERSTGFILSPYGQIVFLMMTGQIEKGKQFMKEQYKISLTPQTTTQTKLTIQTEEVK